MESPLQQSKILLYGMQCDLVYSVELLLLRCFGAEVWSHEEWRADIALSPSSTPSVRPVPSPFKVTPYG